MNIPIVFLTDALTIATAQNDGAPLLLQIILIIAIIGASIAWLWSIVETCNRGYWTWLIVLMFMPTIGVPLYYWFGPETTKRTM